MSSPQPGLPPGTETIAIIDYGGQTAQLIARRVREHGVFCELLPWDAPRAVFEALAPRGYILSGGPESVYAPDAPSLPSIVLESGVPVLGICYGMQLLSHALGGRVAPSAHREYGLAELERDAELPLFRGLPQELTVWMSHADRVDMVPDGFRALGHTRNAPAAIVRVEQHAHQALSRSTRGYILETGAITKEGPGRALLHDDAVREAYLGVA